MSNVLIIALSEQFNLETTFLKQTYQRYKQQQSRAVTRKIEWHFTFETWLKKWIDSGKLLQRGRKKDEYCMARFGDTGPYSEANTEIITNGQNHSDFHKYNPIEPKPKPVRIPKKKGRKPGFTISDETKAKMSAAKQGCKHSAKTKAKMSKSQIGKHDYNHTPEMIEHLRATSTNAKKCSVNGVVYDSAAAAGRALGTYANKIRLRLYSNDYPNYFWL